MADSILKFPDRLRIEGVMAKGYGSICKYPMQDTDLDIAAKAVYSLLCALAGDDHSVFPSRDKIVSWLNVGRNKYNAGMRQLRDQGYILVEQVKGAGSRFAHNSYTIVGWGSAALRLHRAQGGRLWSAAPHGHVRPAALLHR